MAEQSRKPRGREFIQWPPTSWLDPIDITRTGLLTVLAGLFGSFADKREVLAALYPSDDKTPVFDYTKDEDKKDKDQVWFDYICDTGDGWDPTYSIACLVAEETLIVEGASGGAPVSLTRGEFTVLGGDQVYPVASAERYRDRLEGPFFAARANSGDSKQRTPVYALPGNHDWYDGLTSFIRLFCQKGRWVGQWTATQTRSYFAIQLPHRWWIWGLDVQLESDLDVPQVNYFKHYATFLQPGDCVILVSPEPTWIEAGRTEKKNEPELSEGQDKDASQVSEESASQAHRNMMYLERLILARHATIPVKIAGDLHHYARYEGQDGNSQLITCGGGGAFLHGTYGLPKKLDLRDSTKQIFFQKVVVPSEEESKSLRGAVMWKLLIRNPWFAVAVGGIYWIYSWLLQSASEALNTVPWKDTALLEYLRHKACQPGEYLCLNVFWGWKDIVLRDPRLFVFTAVIVVGCAAFAVISTRPGSSRIKCVFAGIIGALHGVAHVMFALVLMKLVAGWISADWFVHFMTLPIGAIPGSILMAGYLWLANVLVDTHDQEVLSTQGIEDYKCFARFQVTKDLVTIYPVGLENVCKEWKVAPGVQPKTYKQRRWPRRRRVYSNLKVPPGTKRIFEPVRPRDLAPRLMEEPIKIRRPTAA